jgi:integrase
MKALREWKLACPANELDLMFPNGEGKPMNYSNMVGRHFLPALRTAELPKIRFHDLRHTYQALCSAKARTSIISRLSWGIRALW